MTGPASALPQAHPALESGPVLNISEPAALTVGSRWAVLRTWTGTRRGVSAAAALLAAAALIFVNGALDQTSPVAVVWTTALLLAGASGLGLLVGSFVGAPIGAEATMCDIRGPLFGMMGLLLATTQSRSSLLAQMFAGLPMDAVRFGVQPAVGVAAVVLMVSALSARLRLERDALADPANAEACATCVPMFPSRRA